MPILGQGRLIGVMYLENNLVTACFDPARIEVLKILLGQIAISIEHAMLYQDLEEKVRQRTHALDRERSELRLANENLDRSLSELTAAQAQLVESAQAMAELSRRAGMADIATGVLHNVGNALNSLNVSIQVIGERLTQFRLAGLGKIVGMLESSGFAEQK